jgi:hypothetical protein
MGIREFDTWLESPVDAGTDTTRPKTAESLAKEARDTAAKARFRSLFYDMHQYIEEKGYGNQTNRYRLAAFALWYATPKELRPVQFQAELAHLLGMSKDDIFRKWRHAYPDLFSNDSVRNSVKQLILEHMPDVIMASIRCATEDGSQGYQDRQMLAKIAEVLVPTTKTEITGPEGEPLRIVIDK